MSLDYHANRKESINSTDIAKKLVIRQCEIKYSATIDAFARNRTYRNHLDIRLKEATLREVVVFDSHCLAIWRFNIYKSPRPQYEHNYLATQEKRECHE